MRILAIGCFHGRIPTGFKRYVKKNKIDAIFALGDYPGERMRTLYFKHSGLAKRDKWGFYDWSPIDKFLGKRRVARMEACDRKDGVRVLQGLNGLGVPVYTTYGNHDNTEHWPYGEIGYNRRNLLEDVIKPFKNITFLDYDTARLGDYTLAFSGVKYPNFYKEDTKRVHAKKVDVRAEERSNLLRMIEDPEFTVVVTHAPPYGTGLDRVNDRKKPGYGQHFGDDVLRGVVKRKQPRLVLCAHFHENQGMTRIGKTQVVCTGYGKKGQAALIELGKTPKARLVRIR
ncbi:MAG: metallophosphoesterase [Candidatus Aenigmatarchaeota archaeon]|nr:MAG: metallophosphoesterase [Candidatus Aenigmarchaeota archaeon]